MYFWPQPDGTVTWTGSFNQAEWDAYMGEQDSEPEDESEEVVGYEDWTVDELKAELSTRNLPVTGRKADLVAALTADDEEGT